MAGQRRLRTEAEKRADRMAGYPTWFFAVSTELKGGAMNVRVVCHRHNTAVNLRHRFHLFRKDLVFEKHPLAEAAVNSTLEVVDDALIFHNTSHIGRELDAAIKAVSAELPEDGQPVSFTQPAGPADPAEDLIQRTYGVLKHEQKDCKHELDTTETRCLHCGLPADLINDKT